MTSFEDYLPNPWGLAALGLAAPIVLAHLLRLRPKVMVVPSIRFWRGEVSEPYVNRPWQRVRDPRGLLLQLVVLLLATLGLTGLQVPASVSESRSTLWFLDVSASMRALTPSGKSRFQLAVEHVRARLSDAGPYDRFGLVTFANRVDVMVAPGAAADSVLSALAGLEPSLAADDPGIWSHELFQQWSNVKDSMSVELLTGPMPSEDINAITSGIGVVTFGSPVPNRGVLHVSVSSTWENDATDASWRVDVSVGEFLTSPAVQTAGRPSKAEFSPLLLERYDSSTGAFALRDGRRPEGGFLSVSLGGADAAGLWRVRHQDLDGFPSDNGVVFRVRPPPPFSVEVRGASEVQHNPSFPDPRGSAPAAPAPALTRMLWTLGARQGATLRLPGSIAVVAADSTAPTGPDDSKAATLTYQPHEWFEGLALETMPMTWHAPTLPTTAPWQPLLTLRGLPVCSIRRQTQGGVDLAMAASLIEDQRFQQSDTFVTILVRWHQTCLEALGIPASGPVDAYADPTAGTIKTQHILSPRESREVASGVRTTRPALAAMGTSKLSAIQLAPWMLLLALMVLFWEWTRYLRRHRRIAPSEPNP